MVYTQFYLLTGEIQRRMTKKDLYIGHCATLTLLQNWTGLALQRISSDKAGNFPK